MRKTLIITITVIILLLVLGGAGVYYLVITREVGEVDDGSGGIRSFFPFGTPDGTSDDRVPEGDTQDESVFIPRLRLVSARPSAGATFVTRDEADSVRFIERETGHVFETQTDTSAIERISNTTIPQIQESIWASGGKFLIAGYLSGDDGGVETFLAEIMNTEVPDPDKESEDERGKLSGVFLPPRTVGTSFSPNGSEVFYLLESSGGSVGIVSNTKGEQREEVFSSPLSEWLVAWPNSNTVTLTTKPSSGIAGLMYAINRNTGSVSKILGGIGGLTTNMNSVGTSVLYSNISGSSLSLAVYNVTNRASTVLPANTLPEKCVWSSVEEGVLYCGVPSDIVRAGLPDAWYQGLVSFSDTIWKINVATGTTELIIDPVATDGVELDVIQPKLNDAETHLLFINKKDATVWLLRLDQ